MTHTLNAPAKINLTLDVIRKRADHYHELRSIMQGVSLFDKIEIALTDSKTTEVETNLSYLKNHQKNTAYIAANAFFEAFGIQNPGIKIFIQKNIPVAAGLAGGSTDAAAVIQLLNQIFETKKSKRELMKLGEKIGADVPFCIYGKTALCEGIGEIVTPLPDFIADYVVLATPELIISTASVFQKIKVNQIKRHPNTKKALECLEDDHLEGLIPEMYNVLEEITGSEYPVIKTFEEIMTNSGAKVSQMSGSGPTVFGIFENKKNAENAIQKLSAFTANVYLTKTIHD